VFILGRSQFLDSVASNGMMIDNDDLEGIWKDAVLA
jgi:hypothetical protein